ncbi:MAG: hypothetical protein LBH93_02490 [Chitinispirillales bacterium]|jgi:hypothetical protein|nr:hypothetical protein [Chitinispirillales bacterium]
MVTVNHEESAMMYAAAKFCAMPEDSLTVDEFLKTIRNAWPRSGPYDGDRALPITSAGAKLVYSGLVIYSQMLIAPKMLLDRIRDALLSIADCD